MAVLFSAVTVTAGNDQTEFFVAGIPRDIDDLEGRTTFDDFLEEIASEQEVSVHVEAYLYGEGETIRATLEEIAYFSQRTDADENFLSNHCDNIEDADFSFVWSPEELFGMTLDES